jgi:ABC-type proline/glycine betaine transport system ATPase subunit
VIELCNVSKNFTATPAVADFRSRSRAALFFVLIGPSGCGKSTVLRMINAMILPDKGQIEIHGQDIRETEPEKLRRGIGYVIQSAGLFPQGRRPTTYLRCLVSSNGASRNLRRGSTRSSLCCASIPPF